MATTAPGGGQFLQADTDMLQSFNPQGPSLSAAPGGGAAGGGMAELSQLVQACDTVIQEISQFADDVNAGFEHLTQSAHQTAAGYLAGDRNGKQAIDSVGKGVQGLSPDTAYLADLLTAGGGQ